MHDIELMRGGDASAEQAGLFAEHVRQCEKCASSVNEAFDVEGAAQAFDVVFSQDLLDDHPDDDDLAAFADGSLGGDRRAEVSSHLEICPSCAAEADDLRAFVRDSIAARRPRWFGWAAAAAVLTVGLFLAFGRVPVDKNVSVVRIQRPRAAVTPAAPVPAVQSAVTKEWANLVADVRRSGKLPVPDDIRELAANDSYRGGVASVSSAQLSPSATAVDELHPEFRWPEVAGAHYVLLLTDLNGREIAQSDSLSETHWSSPEALQRGETYRWQVTAEGKNGVTILPEPPAPPAIFRVLSATDHAQLEAAARAVPDDHLLLGILSARVGHLEGARQHLTAYAATSSDPLAEKLLSQISALD